MEKYYRVEFLYYMYWVSAENILKAMDKVKKREIDTMHGFVRIIKEKC